jgi:hypothetical protein
MKYKWEEPKTPKFSLVDSTNAIDANINRVVSCSSPDALGKIEDDISEGKFADEFFAKVLAGSDEETFDKELHSDFYDDENEEDGLSSGRLSALMARLVNSKDALKEIEKAQKDADKAFTKYLSIIEKKVNGMSKSIPSDKDGGNNYHDSQSGDTNHVDVSAGDTKRRVSYNGTDNDDKSLAMKKLVMIQKTVTKTQSLYAKAAGGAVKECKFGLVQDRRVFAKAAAFNPKSIKESALFESYAEEAAMHDIMTSFECPGMN